MKAPVLNDTMRKFGAPQTIIHSFEYWSVLLRPAQATLGALVLAAHEPRPRHFQNSVQAALSRCMQLSTRLSWR